ncbi:MAG: hypothetical protein JWL86_807 [Rhizobium sp.]|nr:hypothetical protein [Rhizobium sp.]
MTAHSQTRTRRREAQDEAPAPLCSKCDQTNDRAPQRYCARCHAGYQRDWRKGRVNVSHETFCFMQAQIGRQK